VTAGTGLVPAEWRELRAGADLALAVDFAAHGRPEAGFADLAAGLRGSLALWETRRPGSGSGEDAGPGALAAAWGAAVPADRRAVGVLGYCVGGVHAARLAAVLAERDGTSGRPAALIVVDPEPASAVGMLDELTAFAARIASVLTPAEHENLLAAAEHASGGPAGPGDEPDELRRLGAALTRVLRDGTAGAFARAGLLPSVAGELCDMFAAMTAYVADAAGFDPAVGWAGAVALVSRPTRWSAMCREVVPVPVGRADLLRSPEVARRVGELVAVPAGQRADGGR
jgi:hypothetical protein